jgi:hypothetical protein
MTSISLSAPRAVSVSARRAGLVLSALAVAFLAFDAVIKLLVLPPVVQSFGELGFPVHLAVTIGVLELACLALYAIPRTAVVGAVLLTGYLGGAIATHVRLENPLFSHVLFPTYVAALLWGGLWLRDRRVGALFARPI